LVLHYHHLLLFPSLLFFFHFSHSSHSDPIIINILSNLKENLASILQIDLSTNLKNLRINIWSLNVFVLNSVLISSLKCSSSLPRNAPPPSLPSTPWPSDERRFMENHQNHDSICENPSWSSKSSIYRRRSMNLAAEDLETLSFQRRNLSNTLGVLKILGGEILN